MIDANYAKIVRMQQADGRLPNTEIARKLGVAEGTVRERIKRLLRNKTVQIAAWVDPLKVGYQYTRSSRSSCGWRTWSARFSGSRRSPRSSSSGRARAATASSPRRCSARTNIPTNS